MRKEKVVWCKALHGKSVRLCSLVTLYWTNVLRGSYNQSYIFFKCDIIGNFK